MVGPKQIHRKGRWPRSSNRIPQCLRPRRMRVPGRGSSCMVLHVDRLLRDDQPAMEEIYSRAYQALRQGQKRFPGPRFPLPHDRGQLTSQCRSLYGRLSGSIERGDHTSRAHHAPPASACQKRDVVSEAARAAGNGQRTIRWLVPKARQPAPPMPNSTARREGAPPRPQGRSQDRGRRMAGRNAARTNARSAGRIPGACAPRRQPVHSASIERSAAMAVAHPLPLAPARGLR